MGAFTREAARAKAAQPQTRPIFPRDEQIIGARLKGMSIDAAAREFGVSCTTVKRAGIRCGINFSGGTFEWTPDVLAELTRLRAAGLTVVQVAGALGVGKDAVGKKARELGLNKRWAA